MNGSANISRMSLSSSASYAALVTTLLVLVGCEKSPGEPEKGRTATTALAAPSPQRRAKSLKAPAGANAAALIADALAKESAEGRQLVVYVGAPWCEPCRRFHAAAEAGSLDAPFPTLTLLEFDMDADRERLAAAGYTPRLIPLFAIPKSDGTASGRSFEGSVKGDGAVAEMTPKLAALLRP